MRRLFLSVLGLAGLGLAGCHHVCSHGVCDCEIDDHCCTRAPWAHCYGGPLPAALGVPIAPSGPIDLPSGPPMPSAKELPKGPDKL
jgi:hypothetical protein